MPTIDIAGLTVDFHSDRKSKLAIGDFDLHIADQEFLCLLGPSGCGKSTVLNALAGFVRPSAGSVSVGGNAVETPGPERGVVFQDANVFPWLTVEENVLAGPRFRGRRIDTGIKGKAAEIIRRVGLAGH